MTRLTMSQGSFPICYKNPFLAPAQYLNRGQLPQSAIYENLFVPQARQNFINNAHAYRLNRIERIQKLAHDVNLLQKEISQYCQSCRNISSYVPKIHQARESLKRLGTSLEQLIPSMDNELSTTRNRKPDDLPVDCPLSKHDVSVNGEIQSLLPTHLVYLKCASTSLGCRRILAPKKSACTLFDLFHSFSFSAFLDSGHRLFNFQQHHNVLP